MGSIKGRVVMGGRWIWDQMRGFRRETFENSSRTTSHPNWDPTHNLPRISGRRGEALGAAVGEVEEDEGLASLPVIAGGKEIGHARGERASVERRRGGAPGGADRAE